MDLLTIGNPNYSNEHERADQKMCQRHPPTEEENIDYISKRNELTWWQGDGQQKHKSI